MKGVKLNVRKAQSNDEIADAAQKALARRAKELALAATERRLEEHVENLQTALNHQIEKFPLAESELRTATKPWIDKAQFALLSFRETCIEPAVSMDEVIEQAKRLSWEQWSAIGTAYRNLDIVWLHDYECALYDTALAEHRQVSAVHEAEHQARVSAIRDATLEGALGEITIDEAVGKFGDQL